MPRMRAPSDLSVLLNAAAGGFRAGLRTGIPESPLLIRSLELTLTGLLGNRREIGREIVREIFSTLAEQFRVAGVVDIPYEKTMCEESFFDKMMGTGATFDRQRTEAEQRQMPTVRQDLALVSSLTSYALTDLSLSPEECKILASKELQDIMDGKGEYQKVPQRIRDTLHDYGAKIHKAAPDCVSIEFEKFPKLVALGYRGTDVGRDMWSNIKLFFTGRDETRISAAEAFAESVYRDKSHDTFFIHGGHSLGGMPAYHVGTKGNQDQHEVVMFNGAPVGGIANLLIGKPLWSPLPDNVTSFHAGGDLVGAEHLFRLGSLVDGQIRIIPNHSEPAVGTGAFLSHKVAAFYFEKPSPLPAVPSFGNPFGRFSADPTASSSHASSGTSPSHFPRPSHFGGPHPSNSMPQRQHPSRPPVHHSPVSGSSSRPQGIPLPGSMFTYHSLG